MPHCSRRSGCRKLACMNVCDGYFLFDMIHLKKADQWQYAKEGIKLAIE